MINLDFRVDADSMPEFGSYPRIFPGKVDLSDISARTAAIPDTGMFQTVYSLSSDKVLKLLHRKEFRGELFINPSDEKEELHNENVWVGLERQKQRIEANHKFLQSRFGDLFPASKTSIACGRLESNSNVVCAVVFKIQRNLSCMKKHYSIRALDLEGNIDLFDKLLEDSNIFKNDALNLFKAWESLKKNGLTLDISFKKNITIAGDPDRIKLFDSLPLLLVDKSSFEKSSIYKEAFIVAEPNEESLRESEDLFEYLLNKLF